MKDGRHLSRDVKQALKSEHGASLVPAAFLAFAVLDAIPTPTDVGYFYSEKWLDERKAQMSPGKFWTLKYVNYYGWDVLWYLSLFAVTYWGGKNVQQKLKLGAWVMGTGAVATVLWKFGHPEMKGKEPPVGEPKGTTATFGTGWPEGTPAMALYQKPPATRHQLPDASRYRAGFNSSR